MSSGALRFHGVMISSTFKDLQLHRQELIKSLSDFDLMHVAMENSPAPSDTTIIESSLAMVQNASAYILIIGVKYGQIPVCSMRNPDQLSITELEFLEAQRLRRPILVFLMGDEHPVPKGEGSEKDPDKQAKLDSFIARAKKWQAESELDRVYCIFNSLQEFSKKTGPALARLKQALDAIPTSRVSPATAMQAFDGIRAPALYASPGYLGSHEFIGRADQLCALDEWAQPSDRHPVLLFEAIGGSGKSILAWKWLNRDAPEARKDWAGRFWYSFYERGAQTRDFLLRVLAYTWGKTDPEWEQLAVSDLTVHLLPQLRRRPWLLVLDGIERLLVDYNRFDAQYRTDESAGTEDPLSRRQPLTMVRDEDSELFRALLSVESSKILITSRLLPRCMVNAAHQPLPGLLHHRLPGLRSEDAETLFRACSVFGESQAIRAYLKENCDCHPLVIGVLAGLVNRFLPARGNFDRWRVARDGGLALDLSQLDLTSRRSHILRYALMALPDTRRDLLGMLAMMLNEFDYRVLVALNPANQDDSGTELSKVVTDLEEHGFLLFDKRSGLYDLHPVVRSVVLGNLVPSAKERAGERVIDYFSTAAAAPLAEAQTLDDVLAAIHLVQTNLTIDRFEAAWQAFHPSLFNALWLNLERHDRNLALLRPFFVDGWRKVHDHLPKSIQKDIINCAAVSLGEIRFNQESCACDMAHLLISLDLGQSIGTPLRNLSWSLHELGRIGLARQLFEAAARLAEAECDDGGLFVSHMALMCIEGKLGNRDAADKHWETLDPLGRDWHVSVYRQGDAEYARLACLHDFGSLDVEALEAAEEIASKYRASRKVRRKLMRLRGQFHLQQKEYDLADAALERAVAMARQAGIRDAQAETALALSRQLAGTLSGGMDVAGQLGGEAECAELELALLWESLGQTELALRHARKACAEASVDGARWVIRRQFDAANMIIGRTGGSSFKCSQLDPIQSWPLRLPGYSNPAAFLEEVDHIVARLRQENADRIQRHSALSIEDRRVANKGHLIHKLKAKDSTGRWAYYFVLVAPSIEDAFLRALSVDETVDLEDFGKVVASCYGEAPTQEIIDYLYEKYNFKI